MLETSNCVNCSRRNPKRSAKYVLSYWNVGIVYCTRGHFLRKGRGENQKFIKYTMDLLSIPEYVIKKGRPHGHRYGKNRETNNIIWLTNRKKKCKKKKFQGIHDRLLLDHAFRVRMIENNRNEEVCRRWDVLADKVTLIICQKKNPSTTRTSGGSISISRVLIPYH